MNFSDPFNRVACKQDKEYHAFSQQLKQAGIDSRDKATEVLRESRKKLLGFCALVVLASVIIALAWPGLTGIVIVFGVLALIWLMITLARGQRLLKQYIRDELNTG